MFKRIMKIVGFAFLGVVGVFGVIAGVMAIRGDFNKETIKPESLYFSGDEEYFSDNKLLISTDNATSKNFYFQVLAGNEGVNVLGVNFTIEGEDVIDIYCDGVSVRSGKIGSNIKIVPRAKNGVYVGGVAKISAISADGLVPTTTELTVYVDVPATDIKPSASCMDTTSLSNIKTKTRDSGIILTKKYYKMANATTFVLATKIKQGSEYYEYNITKNAYELDNPLAANMHEYIDFVNCYEDAYIVTMLNGQELSISSLYNVYPSTAVNPINAGGYSAKEVKYFIVNAEDRNLIDIDASGTKLVANNANKTGDIRLLMAMYPTYTKQRQAEELIASGALIANSTDHFNNYMITREVVVRVDATSIDSMTASKQGLSLDLYKYTELMLNSNASENNLGIVIKDSAQNVINTLYPNLKFEFVSSTDSNQVNLNTHFTITDKNETDVPLTSTDIDMQNLTGDKPLYIYPKIYVPKAYLKVSYMSGEIELLSLYIELITSYTAPGITMQGGTSRIDKLIDLDKGIDDEGNISDLSGLFTLTSDESVYNTILYFAVINSTDPGYTPSAADLPICTLPGKTYGENAFLIGYFEYQKATEFDVNAKYYILYNGNYAEVINPISANIDQYYTRDLVLDKAKTCESKKNGTFSVMAVVVRTNYLGQIVDCSKTGSVYGEELDLTSGSLYDFNREYGATGEMSAMAASSYQKTFTWNYRLQNVSMTLKASIDDTPLTNDKNLGEYYAPTYIKSTEFKNAVTYYTKDGNNYLEVTSPVASDLYKYYEVDTNSRLYYLREQFASNRTAELKLEITDMFGYNALQHIISSGTCSVSARMYNIDGSDYIFAVGDNITNYMSMGSITSESGKFVLPVSLYKATPANTYISFVLSVTGYATTFPNDSSVHGLDRIIILSSAVSSIDIIDDGGSSILTNNSASNPLVINAVWNDTNYDYYIGSKKLTNATDFFKPDPTSAYKIEIQPSYAIRKTYTYYSSNSSIISVAGNTLTIGNQVGTTTLTINCDGYERKIYIELKADSTNTANVEINNINPTVTTPFGGIGYEDLPALTLVQLTDNTNTSRVNYKVNSYSKNDLLTFSEPIVYNEKGQDITESCAGKFTIPEISNESGRYLAIAGSLTSKYYIVIKVKGPFAAEKELKLYLHSAVTVEYNNYGTYSVGTDLLQEVYAGTTYKLLDTTETKDSFASPIYINVQGETKLLGGDNGIASITYALSNSYTGNFDYTIANNKITYTTSSTDTAYQIMISDAMVGKYLRFKIEFKNSIADAVYYTVYVRQNLQVVATSKAITDGNMTVYSDRDYAISNIVELYSYASGVYTNYATDSATKIDISTNAGKLSLDRDTDSAINLDNLDNSNNLPTISVGWLDNTITNDTAILKYNGIAILTLTAKNPIVILQTNSAQINGMSAIKYDDLGSLIGLKAYIVTEDTAVDTGKTYYTVAGSIVANPTNDQLHRYYEAYDFDYNDLSITLGDNEYDWNDDNIEFDTLTDGNQYIYIMTNPSATTELSLLATYVVGGASVAATIDLSVVTNLPTDFIKAENTASAGNKVDLRDYINTTYTIDVIDNGEIVQQVSSITLSEESPFISVDGSIAILDKYEFVVPEPNNGTNSRELTFRLTTSFGYTTEFVIIAKSSTNININYPTSVSVDGHGYEQVVAGQTVNLTTIDNALGGYLRAYAEKQGTKLPLTISYTYDAARDNFDATSIIMIDNANGTITFNASAPNMFAVTLTEAISGMKALYYFYINNDSELTFQTTGNNQTIKIDKDNLTFNVKDFAKVKDGADLYIGTDRNAVQYNILYTTDQNVIIVDGELRFTESSQDHDYIIAVYNGYYFFGVYTIHTTPNIDINTSSIAVATNGQVIDNQIFSYNGENVDITSIEASEEVASYLTIDGSQVTTKYVPSLKSGYLYYTLSMKNASGEDIGEYKYTMPITLTVGEYFAKTGSTINYSTQATSLEFVGDGISTKFSLKTGEGLYNSGTGLYMGDYLLIDTGVSYSVKTINGNIYTNQDLGQYYTENGNVFTFKAVPADVRLKFTITTDFGYQVDLYITIFANIQDASYTQGVGSLANPYEVSGDALNRTFDIADYLSIKDITPEEELLVVDNFTITAEDVTSNAWSTLEASEYYSLANTTLTVANLARDLSLKLTIHIKFDATQSFAKTGVFYVNVKANYKVDVQYAKSSNTVEYVETGDMVELNNADNYLSDRQSATSDSTILSDRMIFSSINGTENTYSNIVDGSINNNSRMSWSLISTTSSSVTVGSTVIEGKTYLVFNNPTNDVHTVVLSFTNQAGISGDLALNVVYKVYPTDTLDAISSIKYNGQSKSLTNTHQLLQENYLNLSLDFVLTTFGSATSNIVFNYLSTEKDLFIQSFETVVMEKDLSSNTMSNTTDFYVTINEDGVVLEMDENIVKSFTTPKMYTIYFYSRVGFLGQYDFTYTQDVIIEPISEEENANYLLGAQQNLRLTDKVSISLASYSASGQRELAEISSAVCTNAGYFANGGKYTMKLSSDSRLVEINTSGSTNDLYSLSSVGQNTTATIIVDIYFEDVRIASYEYDIVIQDHLKISLGDYDATKDVKQAYLYLGDYYNMYDSDIESVQINLRSKDNNPDGIFFTLHNLASGKTADASDIYFNIDYSNSSNDIASIVTLNNGLLTFNKDVTKQTTLVLLVNHAGTDYRHTYTIYIEPSVVFSTYSDGNSSPYVYKKNETIYSLSNFDIATTTMAEISSSDTNYAATESSPIKIYKQIKNNAGTSIDDKKYFGVVMNEVAGKEAHGVNIKMEYAVFDSNEALINSTTGYLMATYSSLTLENVVNTSSVFSIIIPNIVDEKILSVKTTITLLGGTEIVNYYFINIKQSITISYQTGETNRTYLFDSLDDSASVSTEITLMDGANAMKEGTLYWHSNEGLSFADVSSKLRYAVSGFDNGLNNLGSGLKLDIGYPLTDSSDEDTSKVAIKLTIATGHKILKNQLSFKLHILAEDSNGSWELSDSKNLAFISSTADIAEASSRAIFTADIIIRPTNELDVLDDSRNEIPTINTQSDLGLSENYDLDFVVDSSVGENYTEKCSGIFTKYTGTTTFSTPELVVEDNDIGYKIYRTTVTVDGLNYTLERTFTYLETTKTTFLKVNYSTFNYYLEYGQLIENGEYINDVKDLKAYVSLVEITSAYGSDMNKITTLSSSHTYNFTLADSYYVTTNLADVILYTKSGNSYTQYNGAIDLNTQYYAQDSNGVYYRINHLTTTGLYEYDAESGYIQTIDSEFVEGKTYYANLAEHLTVDGVFTLPYEAWNQDSTTTYIIKVETNDGTYTNNITLKVSAKR